MLLMFYCYNLLYICSNCLIFCINSIINNRVQIITVIIAEDSKWLTMHTCIIQYAAVENK